MIRMNKWVSVFFVFNKTPEMIIHPAFFCEWVETQDVASARDGGGRDAKNCVSTGWSVIGRRKMLRLYKIVNGGGIHHLKRCGYG